MLRSEKIGGSVFQVKALIAILVIFSGLSSFSQINSSFPNQPDASLTPGVLCTTPNSIRYPERIPYCERNVTTEMKWTVMNAYMTKYHFRIDAKNRYEFKIDHFIPLCMGGANSVKNLWPQYKDVYEQTDQLEFVLCQNLSEGKITQAQAIKKIKLGKLNLDQAPGLIKEAIQLN